MQASTAVPMTAQTPESSRFAYGCSSMAHAPVPIVGKLHHIKEKALIRENQGLIYSIVIFGGGE